MNPSPTNPLRTLLLALALALSASCAGPAKDATTPTPGHKDAALPPCCRRAEPVAKPTDKSLYQLDSEWTSDVGRKVRLGVFQGRPLVLVMFFANCEYACPVLVNDLKRLQDALPEALRGQVDFALVSFDTERDTPGTLARFRADRGLGTDHWSLLTGRPDDVRELAALLGVNYRRDLRGQFAHSNLITVLDADGEVVHQVVGLNQDLKGAVKALEEASAKPSRGGKAP